MARPVILDAVGDHPESRSSRSGSDAMKRSALGCFQRGVLSTRANFGLVGMAVLQNFMVVVLFVVSVVPLFLVIGGMALFAGGSTT